MEVTERPLADVRPYDRNPRNNDEAVAGVARSIKEFGFRQPIVVDADGVIVIGHTRYKAAQLLELETVPVHVASGLSAEQVTALRIADNSTGEAATWDLDLLPIELESLRAADYDLAETGLDPDLMAGLLDPKPASVEETPIPDPPADPVTKPGDLWQLGEHRLLCGDSTNADHVGRLLDGAKAGMMHADPPYGMGKEADGVANDNLYAEKLDAFQMAWWKTWRPHLDDNASAYIWGNAESLWRLWYVGGLSQSERLTFRNEIVWSKGFAQQFEQMTEGNSVLRSYNITTERCLFFMLGEQGFNNNADNYWEGWEPIRSQLKADCDAMGWGADDIKKICGVGMYGHWFTKSQWTFIPREHYEKLQAAAQEHDAFKQEHDELKQEHDELKHAFYETRAYFDNTHDNITDVWEFTRVTGDERHGHATPKPVAMIGRAITSSTPRDALLVEPFMGSGSTLIAAEQLGRKCYGMEISPAYCDVIVARWEGLTGRKAELVEA